MKHSASAKGSINASAVKQKHPMMRVSTDQRQGAQFVNDEPGIIETTPKTGAGFESREANGD